MFVVVAFTFLRRRFQVRPEKQIHLLQNECLTALKQEIYSYFSVSLSFFEDFFRHKLEFTTSC